MLYITAFAVTTLIDDKYIQRSLPEQGDYILAFAGLYNSFYRLFIKIRVSFRWNRALFGSDNLYIYNL